MNITAPQRTPVRTDEIITIEQCIYWMERHHVWLESEAKSSVADELTDDLIGLEQDIKHAKELLEKWTSNATA